MATDTAPPNALVRHVSQEVECRARQRSAVVSVIDRSGATATVRFVLWCSLRGSDQCDEACQWSAPLRGARQR
jgi:hypothetical protein